MQRNWKWNITEKWFTWEDENMIRVSNFSSVLPLLKGKIARDSSVVLCLVAQSASQLAAMDCSLPGTFVHADPEACWVVICPCPLQRISQSSRVSCMAVDSLLTELQGIPYRLQNHLPNLWSNDTIILREKNKEASGGRQSAHSASLLKNLMLHTKMKVPQHNFFAIVLSQWLRNGFHNCFQ